MAGHDPLRMPVQAIPTLGPALAPGADPVAGAHPVGGPFDGAGAADFRRTLDALQERAGGVLLRSPGALPATAPVAADRGSPLADLSVWLAARDSGNARRMARILRQGDAAGMDGVLAALSDQSVTNQVLAKAVGKAVSGIDQLTRLT